ncbi:MAG: hypothetical protein BWY67_01548 [Bacteroidetes bacterium ADurb.Bin397]|nr:MAG: hypothetical protein BWY67_01548 [Bacteroidetes bacterium ADurb.Bin397]
MCIKEIATDTGKVHDIGFCYSTAMRKQSITNLNFFKIFSERMNYIFFYFSATDKLFTNMSKRSGGTLNCCALHVMLHTSDAAHFFATTSSSGSTVNKMSQWRTMTCGFSRTGFIYHHKPAMPCSSSHHNFTGKIVISRKN